jgi:hypothetical protein
MRRLHPVMKTITLLLVVASTVFGAGCHGGDSGDQKPMEPTNTTGKPRTALESQEQTLQRQAGESAAARMAEQGRQMKEAMKHQGGN